MNDVSNPNLIIKVPDTRVVDARGHLNREWVYFFNSLGESANESIAANLVESSQRLAATLKGLRELQLDVALAPVTAGANVDYETLPPVNIVVQTQSPLPVVNADMTTSTVLQAVCSTPNTLNYLDAI